MAKKSRQKKARLPSGTGPSSYNDYFSYARALLSLAAQFHPGSLDANEHLRP